MKNTHLNYLVATFLLAFAVVTGCRADPPIGNTTLQTGTVPDGSVSAIQDMLAKRASHTATLLNNGKVLVTGGFVGEASGLKSAELFEPAKSRFSRLEDMSVARASHTATLLPNGKILIAGGFNGGYLDSAEIYDPKTNKFTAAGNLTTARSDHVAVLLNNGKVLIAGGVGIGWTFLANAEIYDPEKNTFTETGVMTTPRESQTVTLLADGRVLFTGGHQGRRSDITIYSSCEIYDPAKGIFAPAGNMTIKRQKHDAVKLKDGRVLIIGGSDERDSAGAYKNAEVFDPDKKTFKAIGNMNTSRYKLRGTAVLLKNGKVLIAGGASRAEVFDPSTDTFSYAAGDMGSLRSFATATLLQNGQVLILGGYDSRIAVSSDAWLYRL